jgi:hypothetical protein
MSVGQREIDLGAIDLNAEVILTLKGKAAPKNGVGDARRIKVDPKLAEFLPQQFDLTC